MTSGRGGIDRFHKIALTVVITIGVIFRIWHWGNERSLWIDEARLALNILARPFSALEEPLWFDQSAPYFFILAVKALSALFGTSEASLRLIPQTAGLLALPFTYIVARRTLSPISALIATAIVSLSPYLIYYSNELKPYSSDLLATLLLIGLGSAYSERSKRGYGRCLFWAGIVSPWATSAAFFVLPGCLLAVLIKRAWALWPALICGFLWATSATLAWAIVYVPAAHNPYLDRFWSERFWVAGPGWSLRVWDSLIEVIGGNMAGRVVAPDESSAWIAIITIASMALVLIGVRRTWRNQPSSAVLLASPIVLVMSAALFGAYPFALRVTLFIGPVIAILVCAGLDEVLGGKRHGSGHGRYQVAMLAMVGPLFLRSLWEASLPERWAPIREVVRTVRAKAGDEDRYYIGAGAVPTWLFYTTNWAQPETQRVARVAGSASAGGYAFENGPYLAGRCTVASTIPTDAQEIFGCSTGMEWIWGKGFSRSVPDPDWANLEAKRIASNACPAIWVVLAHSFGNDDTLHRAIQSKGLRKVYETGDRRALATRYSRC